MRLLFCLVPISVQALIVVLLTRQFGPVAGVSIFVGWVLLSVLVAGALLRTTVVQQMSWKNRVAGLLLPWSMIAGGGTLKALLIKNALAGCVFGVIVVVVDALLQNNSSIIQAPADSSTPQWVSKAILVVTVLGWLIMLVGWLWVLRAQLAGRSEPISTLILRRSVRIPLLVPPIAIAASVALSYFGHPVFAMLIVMLPILFILGPLLAMLLMVLIYTILGKPIRWN